MKVVFVVEYANGTYFIFSVSSETAKTIIDIKRQMSTACGLWAKEKIYHNDTSRSTYFWFFDDAEHSQEFRDCLTEAGLTFTFIAEGLSENEKHKFFFMNPEATIVKADWEDIIPIKLDVMIDYWDTDDCAEDPDLANSAVLHLEDNEELLSDVLIYEYGRFVSSYHIRDIKVL